MTVNEKVLTVPLIVACAMFMESIDENIVVTALPALARDFGRDPIALRIAVTSYVLGLGAFIPVCGWLATGLARALCFALQSASSWRDPSFARRQIRSSLSRSRDSCKALAAR